MEENVALDTSKQKQFVESIKGIKKILKVQDKNELKKKNRNKVKIGKINKTGRKKRGLVYLSHIPHGFYEHQMTEYFKQFGVVTNARVIRSKRTGMSKGHAFVEFKDPNVAQIVAETMNNYLMGKRLIKGNDDAAAIVPPEKQRKFAKRKHWNAQHNPGNNLRQKMKKGHNSIKDEKEELQIARKLLSNLNKTKKRLRELGIDYDFFTPVDIPEPLLNLVKVKSEEEIKTTDAIKNEKKLKNKVKQEENAQNDNKKKKGKKVSENEVKPQVSTIPIQTDSSARKKLRKSKEIQHLDDKTNLRKLSVKENVKNTKVLDAEKIRNVSTDKKENGKGEIRSKMSKMQKQKEEKLKGERVKPPKNFIQLRTDSVDESNSSAYFDSDEYDKEIEDDSDVESDVGSDESDEDLDEDITSNEGTSVADESSPPKKVEKPLKMNVQGIKKPQGKKLIENKPPPQVMKRKLQKDNKPTKKPKFEKKGNKKTINKVIKKKQ